MAEPTHTYELKEPPRPDALLPRDYPWIWAAGIGVFLLALLGAFWIRRHFRRSTADPRATRQAAFADAQSALARIQTPDARSAAVQASLILRKYLAIATADPALYETHEEFVARADALKELAATAREACATGFTTLAACKYSPDTPTLDAAKIIAGAQELLATLHHGFPG